MPLHQQVILGDEDNVGDTALKLKIAYLVAVSSRLVVRTCTWAVLKYRF